MAELEATPKIWTIKDILTWSTDYLRLKGSPSPRLDVELLLSFCLKLTRIQLYTHFDRPLDQEERLQFKSLLQRRVKHEPIAYIVGKKEFFGRDFLVDDRCLIPRPDSELLIETLMSCTPQEGQRVLDVGTGSGCLAVTIAKECPGLDVEAWDISDATLLLAQDNANRHEASVRHPFVGSWFLSFGYQ